MRMLKPRLLKTSKSGGWKPDEERGSRQERGYGRQWEKDREETLKAHRGLCQVCLSQGRTTRATQVDHIVNKAKARVLGWTPEQIEAPSNRQAICDACHREKTQREALEARGG